MSEIISELKKIQQLPLSQKVKETDQFIGEIQKKIDLGEKYSDLTSEIKGIAGEVHTEVKKLTNYYDKLIEMNPDEEVRKDIDNLVSMWCDVNIGIIEKSQGVTESLILEKNMTEVFSDDLISIKIKASSLVSDIDSYLKNKNVRTASRLRGVQSSAAKIIDEVQDGVGYGQNWNNFGRKEAKDRIYKLNSELSNLVNQYTDIVFSEKDFSQAYLDLVTEINKTCNRINALLKKMTQKGLEASEGSGTVTSPNDLAWGIINPHPTEEGDIIGIFKKRKWIGLTPDKSGGFVTDYGVGSSLYKGSDDFSKLFKEQKNSIKREDSTWFENEKVGSDWEDTGWTEVSDPKKIDFFNKCWQYTLVEEKRWICKNSKGLYDSSGNHNFTDSDMSDVFTPSEKDIENFDPVKEVGELKKFPNYFNSYYADSVEFIPTGGGSQGGGGGGGLSNNQSLENYYHTDQIKPIRFRGPKGNTYFNDLPNRIDGGPDRTWYREANLLNTKWFKPGLFGSAPSKWWMRVKNGIWEFCEKTSTAQPKDGVDAIESLNQKLDKENIQTAVDVINGVNKDLSAKIKEQNEINKYWGMGQGKTNVSRKPWGYDKGEMNVEKAGTSDERCGGEISPSAWGWSPVNDDVIIYYYKNGNFEIGDDDYQDRIWGSWGIDSDKEEFYIKWDLYATSSTGGWKSITSGVGRVGQTVLFTCPISDGLKGVLDKAAVRFLEVFY